MTRSLWTTACALAASAASLTACATSNYPIRAGQAPLAPIRPQYPATAQATPPPTPTPAPMSPAPAAQAPAAQAPVIQNPGAPPPSPAAPPPAAVESQSLPPAADVEAPPSPAQSALPPGYTPPSPTPAPPPPTPRPSYAPPPEYAAPPPSYRPASPRSAPRFVAGGKVVEARGMFRDYEVLKGDHVDAIARDLKTTRQVLVDANHLKAPYALQPGQHLKVPVAKAYEVQSGDTLAAVAKRFNVTAAELADLNDLPVRGRLKGGDRLALPDTIDDRGPTRLASQATVPAAPARVAPRPTYRPAPAPVQAYASPAYPAPSYATPAEGGPYVPSPAALAAAQRLAAARAYAAPSAVPSRAGTTTAPAPAASRPYTTPRPYTPPSPSYGAPAPTPAAVIQAGQGRFVRPVQGEILAGFGVTGLGRRNDGIDIKAPQGAVVRAAAAGNVVYAGDQVPGFGNLILIKHADGWVTAYAHLDSITVQMKQTVVQGQAIGEVGQSGGVGEPQLHFEVRYAPTPTDKARPVDPALVLPK